MKNYQYFSTAFFAIIIHIHDLFSLKHCPTLQFTTWGQSCLKKASSMNSCKMWNKMRNNVSGFCVWPSPCLCLVAMTTMQIIKFDMLGITSTCTSNHYWKGWWITGAPPKISKNFFFQWNNSNQPVAPWLQQLAADAAPWRLAFGPWFLEKREKGMNGK